jgi:RNase P/RNase MRP subunit p30
VGGYRRGLFLDFSIKPTDDSKTLEILRGLARLGYCVALVELSGEALERVLKEARKLGLVVVPMITIRASTRRELDSMLSRVPRGAVVSVEPLSVEAARRAAVSKAVDSIRVPPGLETIVDRSTRRLFAEKGWGVIEVSMRHLIERGLSAWRHYYLVFRRAYVSGLGVVVASDAGEPWQLWHPMHLIGLMAAAGIPRPRALSWLSGSEAMKSPRLATVMRGRLSGSQS